MVSTNGRISLVRRGDKKRGLKAVVILLLVGDEGKWEWAAEGLSNTVNCQLCESKKQEVILSSRFSRIDMNLWLKPVMRQWAREANLQNKHDWGPFATGNTLTTATFRCDVFTQDTITLTCKNYFVYFLQFILKLYSGIRVDLSWSNDEHQVEWFSREWFLHYLMLTVLQYFHRLLH